MDIYRSRVKLNNKSPVRKNSKILPVLETHSVFLKSTNDYGVKDQAILKTELEYRIRKDYGDFCSEMIFRKY